VSTIKRKTIETKSIRMQEDDSACRVGLAERKEIILY